MRQIDFEHGGIAQNILKAALPMLVAQVLNLLYNIVDRIYIARIPDVGTAALGAVGLCFPLILRRFADDLDPNRYKFLYISDSKLTPRNFYRILLCQMGFTPKYNRGDAKRQLHEEIEIMKAVHGIQPVCVCDECHLMNREML